jgi:DNA polymerase I-like protein with 3'-5' exonuclease and polymerase domains
MRSFIRPAPGYGLAYIDWSQQEFGIAAVLSGDAKMIDAYASGDPYLAFAIQAGAAPVDATKESHPHERSLFKACALAVQYGMGADSLANKINRSLIEARNLLTLHHETYENFWTWSDGVVDYAMLYSNLWATFGWTVHIGADANPRFLRNFPMQANGAEMLRIACIFATERGIRVCAPVHDALLIEAPLNELEDAIAKTQAAMADASAAVLDGFRLRSDVEIVRHPDRYSDKRGRVMWDTVQRILSKTSAKMKLRGLPK